MTTFDDVLNGFDSLSFTVRPDHVQIGTKIPFGEYSFNPVNFSADGIVYHSGYEFTLTVYMDKLDDSILSEVIGMLNGFPVVWSQDPPVFDNDSNIYSINFYFGI